MKTEEELIELAKNNDTQAQSEILNNYKQLVAQVTRKYFLTGGDQEDLLQEGMIALYFAINSYDKTKGVPFRAYAKTLIERKVINAIKSDRTGKHSALNTSLPINSSECVVFNDDDVVGLAIKSHNPDPESFMLGIEGEQDIFNEIEKVLSDYELKVLQLFLHGKKQSDIAVSINATTKSVDNALNRIKSKLQFLKEKNQ